MDGGSGMGCHTLKNLQSRTLNYLAPRKKDEKYFNGTPFAMKH
jgi:hypothetical protein